MISKTYLRAKVYMVLMFLVIIGSVNWGLYAFGFNLVKTTSNGLNNLFKSNLPIDRVIYIIVAVSAIVLAINRNTWLPFLGQTVLPDTLIPLKEPTKTNRVVTIKTLPNMKIAYWAALPSDELEKVDVAYNTFENSGVVMSDANGNAQLSILEGSAYKVPSGRTIPRHIHYRVLGLPYGMVDEVKSVYY